MHSRPHVAMLAAAMAAIAGPEFLGAQAKLPMPVIPSLPLGGGNSKPGKHRLSGTGSPRQNRHTDWSGALNLREADRVRRRRMTSEERRELAAESRRSKGL